MLIAALIAFDSLLLKFPTGGEIAYVETFRVSEKSDTGNVSGEAERVVKLRVKETSKGRTRFLVSYGDLAVKQGSMADDLRTWLETEDKDEWVNERGYVDRKEEPRGSRPFFGLVLPAPASALPDKWTAKLLPPIGSERATEFTYKVESQNLTADVLTIGVSANDKNGSITMSVTGHVVVSPTGEVRFGDLSTTLVDSEERTTTVIEYRFRKT
jgi:hypothetical protein